MQLAPSSPYRYRSIVRVLHKIYMCSYFTLNIWLLNCPLFKVWSNFFIVIFFIIYFTIFWQLFFTSSLAWLSMSSCYFLYFINNSWSTDVTSYFCVLPEDSWYVYEQSEKLTVDTGRWSNWWPWRRRSAMIQCRWCSWDS